jgi:hypothetical protein
MWWEDLLWGLFNGFTAWIVWFAHLFKWWESQPVYDPLRAGGWYDFGFLFGAGSPFLGLFGGNSKKNGGRTNAAATSEPATPRHQSPQDPDIV